ncbi:hypothetical protein ACHAXA_003397 [Cyclostephanos tholiformis]|uniref:Plastid lipid-associated protein/fibrillin conserved domain-containing protein n=1 Tax=Cyclostephanos tholiformis TaxID=382380 RepID=A0ABD3RCX9_9STRA
MTTNNSRVRAIAVLLLAWDGNKKWATLALSSPSRRGVGGATRTTLTSSSSPLAAAAAAAEGFAPTKERIDQRRTAAIITPSNDDGRTNENAALVAAPSIDEAKAALIDLVPRMTGNDAEYRSLESYINLLEERYAPVLTLDFLNLAMAGEWQLLFSTNLLGRPSGRLRLRGMLQRIETDGLYGELINVARWEYDEGGDGVFDAYGDFNVKCTYAISRGSRMAVTLNDHELRPAWGSSIPEDVPNMVGYLHRAIPRELFDPNGHSMDITYLDANLRIVRLTGPNHEGVRNIFMRRGSLEINPVGEKSHTM